MGVSAQDKIERRFSGEMEGDTVEFSPDLRTTPKDWFYYNFETKSKKAGNGEIHSFGQIR